MLKILVILVATAAAINCFDYINVGSQSFRKKLERVLEESEDSQCKADLRIVMKDFYDKRIWAMKLIDASGKPGSGILYGNIMQSGNYDECLSVAHKGIAGKYCTTVVTAVEGYEEVKFLRTGNSFLKTLGVEFDRSNITEMFDMVKWTWGVCIPVSCSQSTIQSIANRTQDAFNIRINIAFNDNYCTTAQRIPLPGKAIFGIFLFTFVGIIIILSTIYDINVYQKSECGKPNALIAFSLYTNAAKLFSTHVSEDNLGAVNGVRVLSITWVILGHTFMVNLFFPSVNVIEVFDWKDHLYNVFVLAGPLAVDTFFALSGFLVIYVYFDTLINKRVSFSLASFYIHRILRLTPSLAMTIVFYLCILEFLGDGPYWFTIKELYVKNCETYWWSSLLYIHNYYNSLSECVNQSWYLAVDTQLYFTAPLLIHNLIRHPRKTLFALGLTFMGSAAAAFSVTYKYNIGAAPFEAGNKYFYYLYHPTHIRMTAWIAGTFWGYFLFKTKDIDLRLKKSTLALLWIIHSVVMLTIAFSHITLTRYAVPYDPLTSAFFNALARPAWAWGVCWIMYACIKGYGGLLNSILSCKLFMILARLNYSMFLIHLPIMLVVISNRRTSVYLSNFFNCLDFVTFFTLTVLLSILWTLAFESPILVLEKLLFGKNKKQHNFPKNGITNKLTIVDISDYKSKNVC